MLESIRDNRLRLDRTIEVSVINIREKTRLLKVLAPNLRTLHHLMLQNKRDFALAINRRQPAKRRRQAWRRLLNRRVKAVRLVEEMGLRTQRLQPLLEKLRQISARMDAIRRQLAAPCRVEGDIRPRRRAPQGTLLPDADHAGEPGHAAAKTRADRRACQPVRGRRSANSPPATCGWSSPLPNATATAD